MRPELLVLPLGLSLLAAACGGVAPGPTGPPAGGEATRAELRAPEGLTLDTNGNLYVSEFDGARVVRIDGNGALDVVAGTGAQLRQPAGLTLDGLGRLLIADRGNGRVGRISADSSIETVPGTNRLGGPVGVAVNSDGDVYVTDDERALLVRVGASGTAECLVDGRGHCGPAPRWRLRRPSYVLLDRAGDLLVSDAGANRVLKVGQDGAVTTLAGTGVRGFGGDGGRATAAKLDRPTGLALDADGNLYVSDSGNNRVRRISDDGTITTIAGSGVAGFSGDEGDAAAAQLDAPGDLEVDAVGSLYVADRGNGRIRVVDHDGVIDTIAGGGSER